MLFVVGISIGVLVGFWSYILWGVVVQFILWTIVCLIIASGIITTVENYYRVPRGTYFRDNNTWFYVGVGAFAVTFVIACFNFGPALLLPEQYPTPRQRSVVSNVLSHLLYGKNAEPSSTPTDPLPWATGTWFWWKATLLYFFLTFGYFWFAFWDEANYGIHAVVEFVRQRREIHANEEHGHGENRPHQQHGGGNRGHHTSLWDLITAEFVVEMFFKFANQFMARRRGEV